MLTCLPWQVCQCYQSFVCQNEGLHLQQWSFVALAKHEMWLAFGREKWFWWGKWKQCFLGGFPEGITGEMWATETSSEQFYTISALPFVSLLVQDIFWWQLLGFRPRLKIHVKLENKQCKMREKKTKGKQKYITYFNVCHTSFIFRFDSILECIKQKNVFIWILRLAQYQCWQANVSS